MRKALLLLLVNLALGGMAAAQNLVLNPSLESYSQCPDLGNQMSRAVGWSAYRGSPDYLNSCNDAGIVSVPLNFAGNELAADGEAYASIIAWDGGGQPNFREHFGAELITPLIPGRPVFLSFKVIMATRGMQDNCRWSVDGVGIRFAMNPYQQNNNFPLPNAAALHLTAAPLDTVEWTMVSGVYVPDSAYSYLVLGNFFDDDHIELVQFNPTGNIDRAFAFIDDICVSYNETDCGMGTGLVEHSIPKLTPFPNPFSSVLSISLHGTGYSAWDVWVQDLLGRRVWSTRIQTGQSSFTIDTSALPEGPYVITGASSTGVLPAAVVVRVSP